MLFFYLDASALVKRFAVEPGSPVVDHLFTRVTAPQMFVLNVGMGEVLSILVRKRNGGLLSQAAFAQALVDFGVAIVTPATPTKLPVDNRLATEALPLIERHAINATDAILLRSCLNQAVALRLTGNDIVLVACDQRLLRAGQAEGLQTFDPQTQVEADLDAMLGP